MDTTLSPALRLPSELYREIIKHIGGRDDLLAVSVASRDLQPEAEYFIWRSVSSRHRQRTKSTCELIVACPRVQPYIHTLSIANEVGPYPSPDIATWESVAKALRCLPNLEVLRIYDGYEELNGWIFDNCSFSLRELTCPFLLDDAFVSFLHTQVRMTAFLGNALGSSHSLECLSPSSLPDLRVLRLDLFDAALKLVPGHPLTHLWINLTYGVSEHFLNNCLPVLGHSTGPLRSFRIGFPFQKDRVLALLSSLATHTPYLRSLGFLHQFTRNDRDIIDALSKFQQLHSLVMWNVLSNDTIRTVADACPSLRLVACLHYSYSHEYMFFPVNPTGRPRPVHDPEFLLWRDA